MSKVNEQTSFGGWDTYFTDVCNSHMDITYAHIRIPLKLKTVDVYLPNVLIIALFNQIIWLKCWTILVLKKMQSCNMILHFPHLVQFANSVLDFYSKIFKSRLIKVLT